MRFEWDPNKAALNEEKHSVTFVEASTVFEDEKAMIIYDPDHSMVERREIIIGTSDSLRVLFISFTQRIEAIRLISARQADKGERKLYEINQTAFN
jgi:uncharacterized protein